MLAVALAHMACAAPLRVLRYHDHTVIIAQPNIVTAYCSAMAGKWDDGTPRKKGAPVAGCYERLPTAWLADPVSSGTVLHEKRHHDCQKYSKNPKCGENPKVEGYR